jgi:hypothetical protein
MTMANAPLWDGTVSDILLIWVCGEAKYFCKGGWTGFTDLPVRQNQQRNRWSQRVAMRARHGPARFMLLAGATRA